MMRAFATLLLPLALAGCAFFGEKPQDNKYAATTQNQFVAANYQAADALISQLSGRLAGDKPLIMATVVNIDALDQSSTLGRLVSEQVSTRLAQGGLRMLEMKLRTSLYMKRQQGEMMLTREVGDVAHNHNAQAVVIGSYAETNDAVFVNIKVVQPQTNQVMAATDYVLAKDAVVRSMLLGR
jgi:TolB-like protein